MEKFCYAKHKHVVFDNEYDVLGTLSEILSRLEYHCGIGIDHSPIDPDAAVCIARLANLAAKGSGDWATKVEAFAAASLVDGVKCGWLEGVFYLEGPLGGQTSAHDPTGALGDRLREIHPAANVAVFVAGWDGKVRQPFAVEIIAGLSLRRQRACRK